MNRRSLRPTELVKALSLDRGNIRHLLGYQQQDAQEFFQHVSSLISNEVMHRETSQLSLFDLSFIHQKGDYFAIYGNKKISWKRQKQSHSPLTGLLANSILCRKCGFQSQLIHTTFDNLSLPVSSNYIPSVYSMLQNYTAPELIDDFVCEKCSMLATFDLLQKDLSLLQSAKSPSTPTKSPAKRKKSKLINQKKRDLEYISNLLEMQNFDVPLVCLYF